MKKIILSILIAGVLVGGLVAWLKYDEWFKFPPYRAHVNEQLKDPASTQYRSEFIRAGWLCGELNSKNSSGGYVGFKKFISSKNESYLEDHGRTGEGSTEIRIELLEIKNKILAERIEFKKSLPDLNIGLPSDYELEDQAIKRYFYSKWKAICEN